MVQIINDPNKNSSFTKGLGQGVITGLRNLLDEKIANKQRQPVVNNLQGMGIDRHAAEYISRQPSDVQAKLLQNYTGPAQTQQSQQYQQSEYPQHGGGQQIQQQGQQGPRQSYSAFGGQKQAENAEKQKLAEQKVINASQKKFLDTSSKAMENARLVLDEALRLKELKSTGKVSNGIAGRRPLFLQNSESEQYEKSGNTLANMLAGSQGGVPTGFRIKFALTQKPGLGQRSDTQDALTERIINEAQEVITKGEIRDMLIEENNYETPRGLEQLVNKRWREYKKNPQLLVDDKEQSKQRAIEQGFNPEEESPQQEQQAAQQEYDTSQESPLGAIARRAVSGVSRAGEAVAGAPGDILSAGLGVGNYLTGGAIPSYGQVQEKLPISLPTSENIKEFVDRGSKGYTKAQGSIEESIDNVVGTVASLFLPTKFKIPIVKNLEKVLNPKNAKIASNVLMPFSGTSWKKALGMGVAGEVGARGAEALGGGGLAQGATKLAFMAAAGTAGTKKALTDRMKEAYDQRDASIAGPLTKQNTVSSQGVLHKLNNVKNEIGNLPAPEQEKILDITNKLVKGIENVVDNPRIIASHEVLKNSIPVKTLVDAKKSLNDWYHLSTQERVAGEKFLSKDGRRYVDQLYKVVSEPLEQYGLKHPEFGANQALGDDIYRGIAKASQVKDIFNSTSMSSSLTSLVAKKLFSLGANLGIRQSGEVIQLFRHSPVAKKAYMDALKFAAEGNSLAAIREAAKVDKEAIRLKNRNNK